MYILACICIIHQFMHTYIHTYIHRAWDEGVAQMHLGERAVIVAPPEYGYGDEGGGKVCVCIYACLYICM